MAKNEDRDARRDESLRKAYNAHPAGLLLADGSMVTARRIIDTGSYGPVLEITLDSGEVCLIAPMWVASSPRPGAQVLVG